MTTTKSIDKLDYEEAYSELENIVEMLETENLPLEKTLELFERGKILIKHCELLLEKAELKIKQLTNQEMEDLLDQ